MNDFPARMPSSGDPRWSDWCRPLLRLVATKGPIPADKLEGHRDALGMPKEFLGNAICWLELEGKVDLGLEGWTATATAKCVVTDEPVAGVDLSNAPAPPSKLCCVCTQPYSPAPSAYKRAKYCGSWCRSVASARRSHERACDAWAVACTRG